MTSGASKAEPVRNKMDTDDEEVAYTPPAKTAAAKAPPARKIDDEDDDLSYFQSLADD